MKIFILSDMEGATGIVHPDQLVIEAKEYNRGRKLLTSDINAAVEGALEAGATDIVVCEGHGSMRNILIEDLNENARLILGPAEHKKYCQIIGMNDSFDAAIFVGFHAKAGNEKAILSHTWVGSAVHHVKVNGKIFGETGLDAGICGEYNIPVVAVIGDDELGKEAKDLLGEQVETIAVKKALARTIAECYPPKTTKKMIKKGVKNALSDLKKHKVLKISTPVEVEIGFYTYLMAKKASQVHGVERISDSEILIKENDYLKAMEKSWSAISKAVIKLPDWMS